MQVMMASVLGIAIVGLASGWVMGTSAAGWGALSVPLLILLGVEPLVAITSSLLASILLSLFGGMAHRRYDPSRGAGLPALLLGGVGVPFGAGLITQRQQKTKRTLERTECPNDMGLLTLI